MICILGRAWLFHQWTDRFLHEGRAWLFHQWTDRFLHEGRAWLFHQWTGRFLHEFAGMFHAVRAAAAMGWHVVCLFASLWWHDACWVMATRSLANKGLSLRLSGILTNILTDYDAHSALMCITNEDTEHARKVLPYIIYLEHLLLDDLDFVRCIPLPCTRLCMRRPTAPVLPCLP